MIVSLWLANIHEVFQDPVWLAWVLVWMLSLQPQHFFDFFISKESLPHLLRTDSSVSVFYFFLLSLCIVEWHTFHSFLIIHGVILVRTLDLYWVWVRVHVTNKAEMFYISLYLSYISLHNHTMDCTVFTGLVEGTTIAINETVSVSISSSFWAWSFSQQALLPDSP